MPQILTDNFHVDGIYTAFGQFLQNDPAIKKYSLIDTARNSLQFIDSVTDTQIDSTKIWGICRLGEVFKYYEGALVPLKRHGAGFIISDFVENINRYNLNLVLNNTNRQMQMGMFYYSPVPTLSINPFVFFLRKHKNSEPLVVEHVNGINDKAMLPLAFGIDMKTGAFNF